MNPDAFARGPAETRHRPTRQTRTDNRSSGQNDTPWMLACRMAAGGTALSLALAFSVSPGISAATAAEATLSRAQALAAAGDLRAALRLLEPGAETAASATTRE